MTDPEKQPEQPKAVQQQKQVIANKVTGTVKWFNVKSGYGFINRDDTKEDVFVHQTAIVKNNPKKFVRSVGDGEVVEFDVVVGEKGNEAANVTGPNGEAVKGSPYAADKRKVYQWYYRRPMPNRPRRQRDEEGDGKNGENGEKGENDNQGNQQRRYRPIFRPHYNYHPRPRGPPRDQKDGDRMGDENRHQRPRRKPYRSYKDKMEWDYVVRPRSYNNKRQGGGGGGGGGGGAGGDMGQGPRPRPRYYRNLPRNFVRVNKNSQNEGDAKGKQGAQSAANNANESTA